MAQYDYDLFVIGAGSGGVRAARLAAMGGARVAVAEEHRVGGTCVVRGCIPKKFMVYASEFSRSFKAARGFGWRGEAGCGEAVNVNVAFSGPYDQARTCGIEGGDEERIVPAERMTNATDPCPVYLR